MNKKSALSRFFVLPLIMSCFLSFFSIKISSASVSSDALKSTVFIGDSTTNSLRFWGVLSESAVWTGDKCTLSMWDVSQKKIALSESEFSTLKSLPEFEEYAKNVSASKGKGTTYFLPISDLAALKKPANIVITIGLNGCSLMSESDFKYEYKLLIHTLKNASPETKIFLNSIFPVAAHAKVTNEAVDRANGWISSIADEEKLPYLDTNSQLKNEYGKADSYLLDSVDGIHWNKHGCQIIMEVLKDALQKYIPSSLPSPCSDTF